VTDGAELYLSPFPTIVELVGGSAPAERARAGFRRAATNVEAVLVIAETGLDVPAVARALHENSLRRDGPFAVVDCSLPDSATLEQQLFSRLPFAGTLALVNLQELPAPTQARLARALRDGQIDTDASGGGTAFDVRVIAGVNGQPEDAIQEGTLRRDLCARFNLRLELPPLRQRAADIPMLIGCLVGDAAAGARVPVPTFSREALMLLAALPWRRNFHELREVLEVLVRAVVGGAVRLEDVLDHVALEPVVWSQGSTTNLRDARLSFERHFIAKVLNRHRGQMEEAARSLGIQRTNLYRKVRQLGIGLPRTR
jgi:DNA-binding NtrC family response regulator